MTGPPGVWGWKRRLGVPGGPGHLLRDGLPEVRRQRGLAVLSGSLRQERGLYGSQLCPEPLPRPELGARMPAGDAKRLGRDMRYRVERGPHVVGWPLGPCSGPAVPGRGPCTPTVTGN